MLQKKERADELVFLQGLAESREQAKRLIMAGKVAFAKKQGDIFIQVEKPGHKYHVQTLFTLIGIERFVGRGAYKLLTALEHFQINVQGFVCLDAGASTGGFTDCLLQYGAAKVYAIDVGKMQLHERLRKNKQVVCLEGINLRTAHRNLISERLDIVVADVSFISLTQILPVCIQWLKVHGTLVALVKPQFELFPGSTDKGVVKDIILQKQAVEKVVNFCQKELNLLFVGVVPSNIKGQKGNQEYLVYMKKIYI